MRIGVVFPQTELGGDAGAVRAWAQRAEELGFTHVLAYDHVVGADPAVHKGWDGPYDVRTTFHEPMVLYGYLAAVTSMELVTGIITAGWAIALIVLLIVHGSIPSDADNPTVDYTITNPNGGKRSVATLGD